MMKNKMLILACMALVAGLSGCAGTDQVVEPAAATSAVAGSATKGPYVVTAADGTATTVEAFELTAGVRGDASIATGEVTDATGAYTIDIPATATYPVELVINGFYIDETTGAESTSAQETSIILGDSNIPATVSVNPIASIQAALVKSALAANPDADVAAVIASSGDQALQAMGIPLVDSITGEKVTPASLSLFDDTADPAVTAAFLLASATIADVVNKSGGTVADFATNAATDVAAGQPLGTAGGAAVTAAIEAAATNLANVDLAANLASGVATAGGGDVVVAADATALATAATNAAALTTLKGFVLSGNALTIGGAAVTVDATGVAANATATVNAVTVAMTLKSIGADATVTSPFEFWAMDTNAANSLEVKGIISAVDITTDAAGNVSIAPATGAELTWMGTTAAGNPSNSTAPVTAGLADVFANAGGVATIDINALLNLMKAGATASGTFNYAIGFGAPVGLADAAGTAISGLFPVATTGVTGRAITGSIAVN